MFLPSIGGTTVYLIGDPLAITDPNREVACRPHDECNGSDVFGTDICTCRPYLAYAIQDCVETAQRGGAFSAAPLPRRCVSSSGAHCTPHGTQQMMIASTQLPRMFSESCSAVVVLQAAGSSRTTARKAARWAR